jgi:hypothetical protein
MRNFMRYRLAVRALILGALATASLLVFPVRTEAVPISGNLNIAGSVMVDSDTIDWLSLNGQTDNEIVVLSATEYMAVLSPLSQGDAIDPSDQQSYIAACITRSIFSQYLCAARRRAANGSWNNS